MFRRVNTSLEVGRRTAKWGQ